MNDTLQGPFEVEAPDATPVAPEVEVTESEEEQVEAPEEDEEEAA